MHFASLFRQVRIFRQQSMPTGQSISNTLEQKNVLLKSFGHTKQLERSPLFFTLRPLESRLIQFFIYHESRNKFIIPTSFGNLAYKSAFYNPFFNIFSKNLWAFEGGFIPKFFLTAFHSLGKLLTLLSKVAKPYFHVIFDRVLWPTVCLLSSITSAVELNSCRFLHIVSKKTGYTFRAVANSECVNVFF